MKVDLGSYTTSCYYLFFPVVTSSYFNLSSAILLRLRLLIGILKNAFFCGSENQPQTPKRLPHSTINQKKKSKKKQSPRAKGKE
jgi:hypothetical protein